MADRTEEFQSMPDYAKKIVATTAPGIYSDLVRLSKVAEQAQRDAVTCAVGSCGSAGHPAAAESFFDVELPDRRDIVAMPATARLHAATGAPACTHHAADRTTYPLWPEGSS